jgi:hypothetical protein
MTSVGIVPLLELSLATTKAEAEAVAEVEDNLEPS